MSDPNVLTTEEEFKSAIQPIEQLIQEDHAPDDLRNAVNKLISDYRLETQPQIEKGIIYIARNSIESLLNTPAIEAVNDVRSRLENVLLALEESEDENEDENEDAETTPTSDIYNLLKLKLKNPSLLKNDLDSITDPALKSVVEQLEGDPSLLEDIRRKFDEPEKVAKGTAKILKAKYEKEGITTSDQLDEEIFKAKTSLRSKKTEVDNLKTIASNDASMRRETVTADERESIENRQNDFINASKEATELEQRLEELEMIQPFYESTKVTPEEMLYVVAQSRSESQGTKDVLPEDLEDEVSRMLQDSKLEAGGTANTNQVDTITRFIKPSLSATLKEIAEAPQLKRADIKASELSDVLKHRNNIEYLSEWIDGLNEKGKKVVPVLMAYIQLSLASNTLNALSRGNAQGLLDNLRKARNQVVRGSINNNPQLANETAQVKMKAFLQEINTWDENKANINTELLKQLVKRSYLSKTAKATVTGVSMYYLWPIVSFQAIGAVASKLGLESVGLSALKLGTLPAYFGGKKAVQAFKPEHEREYKFFGARIAGALALGPIGLAAPELWKGTKFLFGNRNKISKSVSQTGKTVGSAGKAGGKVLGAGWALTKGVGKVATYPFRRKKAA